MKYYSIVLLILMLNCKPEKSDRLSAQEIIDRSIEVSGANLVNNSVIDFKFRNKDYSATRNEGIYKLSRTFLKDSFQIEDRLSNEKFERLINNKIIELEDSTASKFSASVNSVHYFSVLPYGLNDKAVNKKLMANKSIGGNKYYTVKVSFEEDGGGEDFEDEFLYWINMETFKVDYLAYSYQEEKERGIRFREAVNERFLNSVRFVDYNNYRPDGSNVKLERLPELFEKKELELVSEIKLEEIKFTTPLKLTGDL